MAGRRSSRVGHQCCGRIFPPERTRSSRTGAAAGNARSGWAPTGCATRLTAGRGRDQCQQQRSEYDRCKVCGSVSFVVHAHGPGSVVCHVKFVAGYCARRFSDTRLPLAERVSCAGTPGSRKTITQAMKHQVCLSPRFPAMTDQPGIRFPCPRDMLPSRNQPSPSLTGAGGRCGAARRAIS